MQTREPRRRVNWLFVLVLIIIIPLLIFILVMMNTAPEQTETVPDPQEQRELSPEYPAGSDGSNSKSDTLK